MAPQAVARPFDVDDDSVVKEPIQQRGGDHGVGVNGAAIAGHGNDQGGSELM